MLEGVLANMLAVCSKTFYVETSMLRLLDGDLLHVGGSVRC